MQASLLIYLTNHNLKKAMYVNDEAIFPVQGAGRILEITSLDPECFKVNPFME